MISNDKTGWLNPYSYPFNIEMERYTGKILEEALALAAGFYPHPNSIENKDPGNEWVRIAERWDKLDITADKTPCTFALISEILGEEAKIGNKFFSIIRANTQVPVHRGLRPRHTQARHHLGLAFDEKAGIDTLNLTVAGVAKGWEKGKVISFDEAYLHSVINRTSIDRLVLIYDSKY
jgi:aspartyl/asparaginyl beta-hydroxylase (cupin superfamily)